MGAPALFDGLAEKTTPTQPTGVTLSSPEPEAAPAPPTALVSDAETTLFLVEPFYYEMAASDDEYVASEPQTGSYGEGDSPTEALVSLLGSLAALRTELRSHGDRISPEHKADLVFLDRILWV